MQSDIWHTCLNVLEKEYSDRDLNMWIRPLRAELRKNELILSAPNDYTADWLRQHFLKRITELIKKFQKDQSLSVSIKVGACPKKAQKSVVPEAGCSVKKAENRIADTIDFSKYSSPLNPVFTFENFVKGKSNEFAFAAAYQVAQKLTAAYNPLLIYGDVGLGKTHLMQAIGHAMLELDKKAKVLYLHSERFVANMVKALQNHAIEKFQAVYRSADILLIDDIQFFVGKQQSQEEFFHTFNTLFENHKPIVLTCDRYPKELRGLKERLRSRFSWGLSVAVESPALETRVAILMNKAEQANISLPSEVAFFIARRIHSNVRELEGALRRVIANAEFKGQPITLEFAKEALRDLIHSQDKLVTIDNIQRVVAEYYKIKVSELLSKRRNRSIVRPRQIAMALAKELTSRSLPEIGESFGGRDHTTVLHASRKVQELIELNPGIQEDYRNLLRILTD